MGTLWVIVSVSVFVSPHGTVSVFHKNLLWTLTTLRFGPIPATPPLQKKSRKSAVTAGYFEGLVDSAYCGNGST